MIVVIGAGVIGTTSAWFLAKAGLAVTVLDCEAEAANGCSYGNAGVIALGHAESWAKPAALGQMARALAARDPAVRVSRIMDPMLWRWGLAFLSNCTNAAFARNSDRLLRLSRYSRDTLRALERDIGIAFEQAHDGAYYLYEDAAAYRHRVEGLKRAEARAFRPMSPTELAAEDPALAAFRTRLAGGLLSDIDSKGDCRAFTQALAALAEREHGAQFRYGRRVTGFIRQAGRVTAVRAGDEEIPCDQVVLATGAATAQVAKPLGIRPLIYPVKGYSATYPTRDDARIPLRPFVDETNLVGVTRLGPLLRVTSTAEFAGHDRSLSARQSALIDAYVRDRFGDAVDVARCEHWAGLRPTTPTGAPYLGRLRAYENAWINAGHGQLGWTMAAGAARILADRMTGRTPEIEDVAEPAPWLA